VNTIALGMSRMDVIIGYGSIFLLGGIGGWWLRGMKEKLVQRFRRIKDN